MRACHLTVQEACTGVQSPSHCFPFRNHSQCWLWMRTPGRPFSLSFVVGVFQPADDIHTWPSIHSAILFPCRNKRVPSVWVFPHLTASLRINAPQTVFVTFRIVFLFD